MLCAGVKCNDRRFTFVPIWEYALKPAGIKIFRNIDPDFNIMSRPASAQSWTASPLSACKAEAEKRRCRKHRLRFANLRRPLAATASLHDAILGGSTSPG